MTRLKELAAEFADEEGAISIIEMHELCVLQSAEIKRLQAFVDKLPVTADGEPVVPCDYVFWPKPNGKIASTRALNVLSCVGNGFRWICYSTREAAEAAKEE